MRRRFERFALVVLVALAGVSSAGLVSPSEKDTRDRMSVWEGVYTEEQARRGEATYRQECSSCHYDDLQGQGSTPPLVGEAFFSRWGSLSMDDMLTAIRTTMPQGAPASLSNQAYVDVMAHMLKVNGIPAGDVELSDDRERLKQIVVGNPPGRANQP